MDKTPLIDDVLGRKRAKVFLFTRPRRFGKSLNLSMLDAYLNMDRSGNDWFDGLAITELRRNDSDKNSCPVVFIDLKDLGDGSIEDFVLKMRFKLRILYSRYAYLKDSDRLNDSIREMFRDMLEQNADITQSLNLLIMALGIHHGRRVVLLVDGYDNAVNNARTDIKDSNGDTDRRKILNFIRSLLSPAIKGNEHLDFAVLTGVTKIGKETIFSGLNNIMVDSVFDVNFDESFGFIPSEVQKLCSDQGRPDKFEEARKWYDGYRFGNAEVYNPWSLLNYVYSDFSPGMYWAGISGNDIIDNLMDGLDPGVFEEFEILIKGGGIREILSETVEYADITDGNDRGDLFSVLVVSGYLRAVPTEDVGEYRLSIPNLEMFMVFRERFLKRMGGTGKRIRTFEKAIVSQDDSTISESLRSLVISIDPKVMSHEHAYEIFCIALMMHLEGPYEITNELHKGKGYCDILLKSNRVGLPHIVIELKRRKEGDPDPTALAISGLNRIRDMIYTHMLTGRAILYGVAFDGTETSVCSDTIALRPIDAI